MHDYAARLDEAAVELAEETTQIDPESDGAADAAAREAGMAEMSQKLRAAQAAGRRQTKAAAARTKKR